MEEPIDTIHKSFRLSPHHIKFLESKHSNLNEAVRICLDTLIKQKKRSRFKNYDKSIIIISLALIFFIFSATINNSILGIITLLFGIFLALYGVLIGVLHIEI